MSEEALVIEADNLSYLEGKGMDEATNLITGKSDDAQTEAILPFRGNANIKSSIFNLVNTIIGGGILALPFAFAISGIVLGVGLIIMVAFMSAFSSNLLVEASVMIPRRGPPTYRALAGYCFGKPGIFMVEIAQVVFLFGTVTGYVVIIGDAAAPFFEEWVDRVVVQAVVVTVFIYPLTWLKQINSLRFTSIIAIVCIVYLTVAIAFHASRGMKDVWDKEEYDLKLTNISVEVFRTVPIISFAFTFHLQMFSFWTELKTPSKSQIRTVVLSSLVICACCYLTVAVMGYLTFFQLSEENILKNYRDLIAFEIAKGGLTIIICFSMPLMLYPLRKSLDYVLFPNNQPSSYFRYVLEGTGVIVLGFILAYLVPDISVVFGFVGATVGNLLVYILPGVLFLRTQHLTKQVGSVSYYSAQNVCAFGLIAVGLFFVLASLTAIIQELLER